MSESQFKPKVLVVDDETGIRLSLTRMIESMGLSVKAAEDGYKARQMMAQELFDIVFLDMIMPGPNGLEVLKHIHENYPDTVVIVMTGFPSVEGAVDCMKLGAMDYLVKPYRFEDVDHRVSKATEAIVERSDPARFQDGGKGEKAVDKILGRSPAIRDLKKSIRRVAATDSTVLLTGESGTGKELVSRAIHDLSPRAGKDFVPVDCSALVESLLESELFGHVKGAFTGATETKRGLFEVANEGTFFFDEVSNLTLRTQTKLLRVIQEREFIKVGSQTRQELDIRIIAASNRDLKKTVDRGNFRDDLYYRLNVVPLHIPSLRERSEDIPLLLEYFLKRYNRRFNRHVEGFSDEAMEMLIAYPYPGNVRELQHVVEQILVLERCDVIEADHLPATISQRRTVFDPFSEDGLSLEQMERRYIQFVLRRTRGIRQQTADILGINRKTLATKIKKYGLETEYE
jgi:DNA-binding NtrC family response regulator